MLGLVAGVLIGGTHALDRATSNVLLHHLVVVGCLLGSASLVGSPRRRN